MIGDERFIEVFVNTPLDVCEQRDTKGIYQQARAGKLQHVTGIDDDYEAPLRAEVELETLKTGAEQNAQSVFAYLEEKGFVSRVG
jgi:adenylylsulfate kinase-like enzyme